MTIRESMVTDLVLGANDEVIGVENLLGGVPVSTGADDRGLSWVVAFGLKSMPAGRAEFAAVGLTETLKQLGFETGRLRQAHQQGRRSLNYSSLEPQR